MEITNYTKARFVIQLVFLLGVGDDGVERRREGVCAGSFSSIFLIPEF